VVDWSALFRSGGPLSHVEPADPAIEADEARELRAEQAVVDAAHGRLQAMRDAARALSEEILELGAGGTHQARIERDVRVNMTAERLARLRGSESGLVFGRTDHVDGETRHIGRLTIDDEAGDPLVVDWRAPVAEAFYRATGRDPMGLVRRRHLVLAGRRVVGLDDELMSAAENTTGLVLMGGAGLLAALDRARTGRMGDIVATIQREQDEIIRAPLPGILVVQGGPGTGKTAIALHRAAYLLYSHRFPLERAGVLLVGPNQVHLRYIESVLPALGEDAVTLATASSFGIIAPGTTDPPATARLKGDARMARLLANAVADRGRPLPRTVSVIWRGERLTLSRAASRRIVERARRRPGRHNQRRRLVERLVVEHLATQYSAQRPLGGPRVPVPPPPGPVLSFDVLAERVLVEALERMWPVLSPEELLNDLYGSLPLLRQAARGLLKSDEVGRLARPRSSRATDAVWSEGDVALLDEASGLLGPPLGARRQAAYVPWTRTWGHVLVDEAQDLSPMQLRMLARHCPSGSMTLAGDLAQASGHWGPMSWDEILVHLNPRRSPRRVDLTVNYRTPVEIMDLAAKVLADAWPGFAPSRGLRHTARFPRFTRSDPDRLGSVLATVVDEERAAMGAGTLAVVVPRSLLDRVRVALPKAVEGARLLDAEVALLTAAEAKGLEFDTVVVVEPAAVAAESPQGGRALYLVLSRSTQRLHVVHAEALPEAMLNLSRPGKPQLPAAHDLRGQISLFGAP